MTSFPPVPTVGGDVGLWGGELNTLLAALAGAWPPTPADTQLVAWSASLNRWTSVNPNGAGRLAAASNVSGTPTTASTTAGNLGTAVDIAGVAISVPASVRPVVLRFGVNVAQTVAGTGEILVSLIETTSGSTSLYSALDGLPGSATTQPVYVTMLGEFDLGVVASTRTFKLQLQLWGGTGSPSAQALNAGNNPSYLRAVAE